MLLKLKWLLKALKRYFLDRITISEQKKVSRFKRHIHVSGKLDRKDHGIASWNLLPFLSWVSE